MGNAIKNNALVCENKLKLYRLQLHQKNYLWGKQHRMEFKILTSEPLDKYRAALTESPQEKLDKIKKFDMPVDYFQFYKSVSSVYSSRIEGEDIEFDSFFKHKLMGVQFKPDYTRKAVFVAENRTKSSRRAT